MDERIKSWVEFVGAVFAWLGATGGTFFAVWKWGRHVIAGVVIVYRLGRDFGSDLPAKLDGAFSALEMAIEEARIRRSVIEDKLQIAIYICDGHGSCLGTNRYLQKLFGLDSTEIVNNGWAEAVVKQDKQRVIRNWMFCVENAVPYEETYRIHNKESGYYYRVRTAATRFELACGDIRWIGWLESAGRIEPPEDEEPASDEYQIKEG